MKFETEDREFANILRSLEQFVRTVKGLKSDKLEQLEFKFEKNIGIQKHALKVRK